MGPIQQPFPFKPMNGNVQTQPVYQPVGMLWVNGLQGANEYPVARGATLALFDQNDEVFYVKAVDMQGNLQPIRAFTYKEKVIEQPGQVDLSQYVRVEEFERLQAELEELKSQRKPQYNKPFKKRDENE